VLASACCWVPLALAGAGVATGTLGAQISWIRPWALGALLILLLGVLGWWARKRLASTKTAADCCTAAPRFPTLAVALLTASFVSAWAAPRLLHEGKGPDPVAAAPIGSTLLILATPQFDCAPCAGDLPRTLAATPGVASVQMDFDQRETRIVFQPGASVDATLAAWKKDLGFEGKEIHRKRM
jgi:copper chaperone CopZ